MKITMLCPMPMSLRSAGEKNNPKGRRGERENILYDTPPCTYVRKGKGVVKVI